MDKFNSSRYMSQTMIGRIGPEGQAKLALSSVAVVGAGGLGSPILTYLAAAGVGHLALIDSDTVSLSNLNRQFLHGESDLGRPKAVSAKEQLAKLNSDIQIIAHEARLTDENAQTLLAGYDLVLGAVDSFDTRAVINRATVALDLPYIDGGVNGFDGCVVFSHPPLSPCLNCVYPSRETKKKPVGVLGTTAGVVGALEANLALLHLLGHPNPLANKLLMVDGFRMTTDLIGIQRNKHCPICGGGAL